MANCFLCGITVHFSKGQAFCGKGIHNEHCSGVTAETRLKAREKNHERAVARFLASKKRPQRPKRPRDSRAVARGRTHTGGAERVERGRS